ncbi:MAG: PQQ-binding-like beta-propeller repeat protein [Lentisphaerae bacterium]|nr:PQQ-binding-like beta-propeller repeat protein [Lentisphaerota bacterium]MBT4820288.1 PQQ-binding-like beta-propeller repeat protein [Lentisphaerota bacterium]MBT5605962.1 PQQ-binding-like beta-propeller repeat protein [Lentisphaerota bacterium]MBT7060532.1 PQQ-binding-like beta-propeller repeat protein [Lentisphaerota bacterium]MBT7847985.1 PQQ-binding-like beta-propeller repeat protein [Lentisphaerota bacterium]
MSVSFRSTAVLFLVVGVYGFGADWPQWRGPALNGSSDETGLPATWSLTRNVRWSADLPGPGAATPIVWGDRVFVSSTAKETGQLLALCLAAKSGEVLWQKAIGDDRRVPRNNMASPSPVTDGEIVCFAYGTGLLVAFELGGKELWRRDLEQDQGFNALLFGYSSSPLLHDGRLYVAALRNRKPGQYPKRVPPGTRLDEVDSYLMALELKTGKTVWCAFRATDALRESMEAYVTPIPMRIGGEWQILLFGGDAFTGHDVRDGRELWRWGEYNPTKINHWRVVTSPVVVDDLAVVAAPKHAPLYAIRPTQKATLGPRNVAWEFPKMTPDASTPLFYRGRLYALQDDRKVITCLEPASGNVVWQGALGGTAVFRASLTGADGKLFVMNEKAHVWVLEAGDAFRVLHQIAMGKGPARSTIAVADQALFIRTADRLVCVSEGDETGE